MKIGLQTVSFVISFRIYLKFCDIAILVDSISSTVDESRGTNIIKLLNSMFAVVCLP